MGRGGSVTSEGVAQRADDEPEGNTPLDEDEATALIPGHLTTRDQLNSWEQANITAAVRWLASRRDVTSPLEIGFLKELHRRMFGGTWTWAGQFRTTERNIGVAPHAIPEQLANLLEDTRHWLDHGIYSDDEVAVRLHHRLVSIHPFPNGNGRHARQVADMLLTSRGARPFSWGSTDLDHSGRARSRYLSALRQADHGDIGALLAFVRT
ncbi:MAG: mobile mystery protein B [Gemmatimonadota bacterium]|nr:mobile mystery protein B [Gemmatimonadota bacterium]